MLGGDLMIGRNRYYCKDVATERGTMAFRCGRRVIFVRRLARRDGRLFGSRMKSGHAPIPPTPSGIDPQQKSLPSSRRCLGPRRSCESPQVTRCRLREQLAPIADQYIAPSFGRGFYVEKRNESFGRKHPDKERIARISCHGVPQLQPSTLLSQGCQTLFPPEQY